MWQTFVFVQMRMSGPLSMDKQHFPAVKLDLTVKVM